jgi:hypothetical protein
MNILSSCVEELFFKEKDRPFDLLEPVGLLIWLGTMSVNLKRNLTYMQVSHRLLLLTPTNGSDGSLRHYLTQKRHLYQVNGKPKLKTCMTLKR